MTTLNSNKKEEAGSVNHDELADRYENKVEALGAIDPSNLDYSGAVIKLDPIEMKLVRKLDIRIMVKPPIFLLLDPR